MSKNLDITSVGNYYIGLDCGTSSVGWAVTDPDYRLLRAKGKTLWGDRLFEEAKTASERRAARSNRRRLDRANNRLKLLRILFHDEISTVDKDFYLRLDESFYRLEDKQGLSTNSTNTLFNDENFKDKDYHRLYPTIWHLRKAIIESSEKEHFDIRLYFLAIQHILKHRGHFLIAGEINGNNAGNFSEIYDEFVLIAERCGFPIRDDIANEVESIICNKSTSKTDKKRKLKERLEDKDKKQTWIDQGLVTESIAKKDFSLLGGLMIGSKVELTKLFSIENMDKIPICFSSDTFEEKQSELEATLADNDYIELIFAAKRIYDYVILKNLLGDANSISSAMVHNYDLHRQDLAYIKKLFKPFPDEYRYFFNCESVNTKRPNYPAYIGKAYEKIEKNGRKKSAKAGDVGQDAINKYIEKVLESHNVSPEPYFAIRLKNGEVLPKQKGQAKGTIPMQLHQRELKLILDKLSQDYPSFAKINPGESDKYNTKVKKILHIHSFRIPYYCGPLKKGHEFSWADEEIKQIVYPWNFDELVDLDNRAEKFITRMTNECSYLIGEKVLPKSSLLYQKYMVLNEVNNLKVNGRRISDHLLKLRIYKDIFQDGDLSGNITIHKLEKYLKDSQILQPGDELSGSSENKYLPKLSTHHAFLRILGPDYSKKYSSEQLEESIKAITILSEERQMLTKKLIKILDCSTDTATQLSKLTFRDWARFSTKFLTGIKTTIKTEKLSILEALYETENNLMELLSTQYDFSKRIEDFNSIQKPSSYDLSFDDARGLYCSPAVKRSVWQAIKILKEITEVKGEAPKKIFLESTREESSRNKGANLTRKKHLEDKYAALKKSNQDLINELASKEDRDFQNKKLYLYFCQMGNCAYCGKPISLDEISTNSYDIDHIYPRSLTKDDSLERNLVLVHAECNRIKTNHYPIREDIRARMQPSWSFWLHNQLISKEKYERLTRATALTDDELGGFIARQIVETSQTVKVIRDLIARAYPNTEVVLVKASQVSEFRHCYGYDHKDKDTGVVLRQGRPEFIKLRELNDLHHAKDAYLNIVVGNTMRMTFTSDPRKWVANRNEGDDHKYSIRTELLFRENEAYISKKTGKKVTWPHMKGWNYKKSLDIVSSALKRNDVLWTRMPLVRNGQISDLQIVGKIPNSIKDNVDGVLPIKNTNRLKKTAIYGGYNSANGAYFSLIEKTNIKKGTTTRHLVQIPITDTLHPEEYIAKTYPESKIIIPKIPFFSLLKRNGFPMHLSGRSKDSIKFYPAIQLFISPKYTHTLKSIINMNIKQKECSKRKEKYQISDKDNLDEATVVELYKELSNKTKNLFSNMPTLGCRTDEIASSVPTFEKLDIIDKCQIIEEILKMTGCNAAAGDLSLVIPKSEHLGWGSFSNNITDTDIKLVHQSVTGLLEREIDLNKVVPKPGNKERN